MPLKIVSHADGVVLALKVVPNSSRTRIAGEYDGALKINIAQAPEGGAANKAVIALLAKTLGIPGKHIEILRGHTAPRKEVLIRGTKSDAITLKLCAEHS